MLVYYVAKRMRLLKKEFAEFGIGRLIEIGAGR